MSEDDDELNWEDIPKAERLAIRRAAQSNIWWNQLSNKVKGLGPFITIVLGAFALWQVASEQLKDLLTWLVKK